MKHLTIEQRYEIQAYLKAGKNQKEIAVLIGKSPSVISRELKRNKLKRGSYSALKAQEFCNERKERFSRKRKFTNSVKRSIIKYLEEEQWSPEQIVGNCKKQGIEMVSVERIYQFIRKDKKEGGMLYKNLRHKFKHRKRPLFGKRVIIKDKVSIHQRPEIIDKKLRFGDWEIDLIVGSKNKDAILTIVERTTKFLIMFKLKKGKNAKNLSKQLIEELLPYKQWILSITSDNGSEFADFKMICNKLQTEFYFASPYSSWQRGLNENTNKLIRQYIPKKQSFEQYNDMDIKQIQYKINRRPRKSLGFDSPKNLFYLTLDKKIAFIS